nr:leucine-rich repeat protein [Clostridiales bacterium]
MKRKLLVVLLALAMLITLTPTAAFAGTDRSDDEPWLEGGWFYLESGVTHLLSMYNVDEDAIEVTSVTSSDQTVLYVEHYGDSTSLYSYGLNTTGIGTAVITVTFIMDGAEKTVSADFVVKSFPHVITGLTIDGEELDPDAYTDTKDYDKYGYNGTSPAIKLDIADEWDLFVATSYTENQEGQDFLEIDEEHINNGWVCDFPEDENKLTLVFNFENNEYENYSYTLCLHREGGDDPSGGDEPGMEYSNLELSIDGCILEAEYEEADEFEVTVYTEKESNTWIHDGNTLSFNLEDNITRFEERPSDGIYHITVKAFKEETVIATGTIDYYSTLKDLTEEDVWTTPGGDLNWIPVSGAESYNLAIGDRDYLFELWNSDNGEFCINDKIDWLIKIGEIVKPMDGKYKLDFCAYNSEGVIAERTWDYYYESDAEYVPPAELDFTIEGGMISAEYPGADEYGIMVYYGVDENYSTWYEWADEGSLTGFSLEDMITSMYHDGYIEEGVTHHHVRIEAYAEGALIAEGETYYDFTPPEMEVITGFELGETGELSWYALENAEWYEVSVGDYFDDFERTVYDNYIDIYDMVDDGIIDEWFENTGHYSVNVRAYRGRDVLIAEGTYELEYESSAAPPIEMTVELNEDGILSWEAVEGAAYYVYSVDGLYRKTNELSVGMGDLIELGWRLKYLDEYCFDNHLIWAFGNNDRYGISVYAYNDIGQKIGKWSDEISYTHQQTELDYLEYGLYADGMLNAYWEDAEEFEVAISTEDFRINTWRIKGNTLNFDIETEIASTEYNTPGSNYEVVVAAMKDGVGLAGAAFGYHTEPTDGECGDNLTWSLDSNGTLTISGTGPMYDYDSWGDAPWYGQSGNIKKVVVESGVTTIGNYAFGGLSYVTYAEIPEGITSIGDWAFYSCSKLNDLTLPKTVRSIGNDAFDQCMNLSSVSLNEGLRSIGDKAFRICDKLTEIHIPASVEEIGSGAFESNELTSIDVDPANPYYSSYEGVLFNKDRTELIIYPAGKGNAYAVPEGVRSIGEGAFIYCHDLDSITLPSSLVSIGDSAFYYNSKLPSVNLPDGLTSIGEEAFYGCDELTGIYLPASLEHVGKGAFSGCNISAFELDPANTHLSVLDGVLFDKEQRLLMAYPGAAEEGSYTVPDTVNSVMEYAFQGNGNIRRLIFGSGLTELPDDAISNARAIKSIIFRGSAPTFGQKCFMSIHDCNVYYPAEDPTWTEEVRQDYYGMYITWIEGEPKSGWIQEDGGMRYYGLSGSYLADYWLKEGNKWYYLNEDGYMQTGWHDVGKLSRYYFDASGCMVTGTRTIDGQSYTFDEFGRLITEGMKQMPLAEAYYYVSTMDYDPDIISIRGMSFYEDYAIDNVKGEWGSYYEGKAPDTQFGWFGRGSAAYSRKKPEGNYSDRTVTYRGETYYYVGGSGDGGPYDLYEHFGDKVIVNDVVYTIYQDRIEGDNGKIMYPYVKNSEGNWVLPDELDPTYGEVKDGWIREGDDWYYYENGNMVTSKWRKDGDDWCYLGPDGKRVSSKWQ